MAIKKCQPNNPFTTPSMMTTLSPEFGTPIGDQLELLFQVESSVPIHTILFKICALEIAANTAQKTKSMVKNLEILYYFYLEVSARKTANELNLGYGVVHRKFMQFRKKIADYCNQEARKLNVELELDESYFGGKRKGNRGRGAKNKTIVFGILERKGKIYTKIVENVSKETPLKYKAHIFFEEDCQMENVRAFMVVHNIKDISSELFYIPEDII